MADLIGRRIMTMNSAILATVRHGVETLQLLQVQLPDTLYPQQLLIVAKPEFALFKKILHILEERTLPQRFLLSPTLSKCFHL